MPVITTIDDLKRLHARRVRGCSMNYANRASWAEQTFRENTNRFEQNPACAKRVAVTERPQHQSAR